MGDVIRWPGETTVHLIPAEILEELADQDDIVDVVVLASRRSGETSLHSTTSELDFVAFEMQQMLHRIYNGEFSGDGPG